MSKARAAVGAEKPTVGRIVHFIPNAGRCTAAIVTGVVGGERHLINLQAFPDNAVSGVRYWKNIPYGEQGRGSTWHWPEREA